MCRDPACHEGTRLRVGDSMGRDWILRRDKSFISSWVIKTSSEPPHPSILGLPAVFFGRRIGRGVDLTSSASSVDVKNVWCHISSFLHNFMVRSWTVFPVLWLHDQCTMCPGSFYMVIRIQVYFLAMNARKKDPYFKNKLRSLLLFSALLVAVDLLAVCLQLRQSFWTSECEALCSHQWRTRHTMGWPNVHTLLHGILHRLLLYP